MKKALVRLALVPSVLAAALLPVPPASAAARAVPDATGDVWRSTFDPEAEQETLEPAGTQVNVDLERTVLRHTATRLVIAATYVELERSTNRFFLFAEVRTNEGMRRDVGVDTTMRWGGTPFLMGRRGEVRCAGLRHSIDYVANTVKVSVPRSCLSRPRWVQSRLGAFGFPEAGAGNEFYLDSASDDTADEPAWTARLRRG